MAEIQLVDTVTPADYGLTNHKEFRPNQREAIDWVLAQEKTAIMSAVTGSGKTSFARALSQKQRTIALVRTKVLQQENYADGYGFKPLYGRSNYPCVHPDADSDTTTDKCLYAEQGMLHCNHGQAAMALVNPQGNADYPDTKPCLYVLAREQAKLHQRSVLNYAYWLNSYERWPAPQILVCDEGHQLSDLVLEWAGCTVSDDVRTKWGLAPFPMIRGNGGLLSKSALSTDRAMVWINQSLIALRNIYNELSSQIQHDEKARQQAAQVEQLGKKLRASLDALESAPDDWYIKSGPGVVNGKAAFVARPLTARHHFKRYFTSTQWRLLIMSATIGDPNVFAAELGLDDFVYHAIPSQFTPAERPVVALDVPRMGFKSGDVAFSQQADQIARVIKECPGNWSGIVHTSSISETFKLAERLQRRGLGDRVWTARQGMSTEQMSQAWHEQAKRKPGSINVNWAMWEGYDPDPKINLKICIAAKVPYPALADEYEIARRSYDGKMYLQRAAQQLEQGCGRSRRGHKSQYDIDGQKNGLVAIADGSWKWVRSYFSESMRDSIVTL
jgi:Rad3-related DNA helicase